MSDEEIIEELTYKLDMTEHQYFELMDKYNKQKEEIERLKNYSELYYLECEKYENSISKDKIRDRIKNSEILKHNYLGNTETSAIVYKDIIDIVDAQINVLKELLEE